jgi:hypothetical protein
LIDLFVMQTDLLDRCCFLVSQILDCSIFITRGDNVGQHSIVLVWLMAFDYIFKRVM